MAVRVLVCSVHSELVHVQDCFARLLHSEWLGKKVFTANPRASAVIFAHVCLASTQKTIGF